MLEINLTKNTNDAIQGTLGKYYVINLKKQKKWKRN